MVSICPSVSPYLLVCYKKLFSVSTGDEWHDIIPTSIFLQNSLSNPWYLCRYVIIRVLNIVNQIHGSVPSRDGKLYFDEVPILLLWNLCWHKKIPIFHTYSQLQVENAAGSFRRERFFFWLYFGTKKSRTLFFGTVNKTQCNTVEWVDAIFQIQLKYTKINITKYRSQRLTKIQCIKNSRQLKTNYHGLCFFSCTVSAKWIASYFFGLFVLLPSPREKKQILKGCSFLLILWGLILDRGEHNSYIISDLEMASMANKHHGCWNHQQNHLTWTLRVLSSKHNSPL